MAPQSLCSAPPVPAGGLQPMVWPREDSSPFGTGSFGWGLEEGFETYLGGGSSSHGYGAAEFSIGPSARVYGPTATQPPVLLPSGGAPVFGAPRHWVAGGVPREPTNYQWRAARTPVPSTELVDPFPPGRGAPSGGSPRGKAKSAKKKSTPQQSGSAGFPVYYQGRQVSWP